MRDATTGEVGCADGALACTASAFLAEWLAATAGDFTTSLGAVGALTLCSKLSINNLVHQRNAGLTVEDVSRQLNLAVGATISGVYVELQIGHARSPPFTAVFTVTRPPRAPGMAPLMISRLASVSIF